MPVFGLGKLLKGKSLTTDELRRVADTRSEGWDTVVLEALSAKEPEIRAEAARLSRHLPPEKVRGPLLALLRDPTRAVVQTALDTVGVLRLQDAVPAVSGLLGSSDQTLKEDVARCLARLGGSGSSSAILDLLDVPRLPGSAERTVVDLGATTIPALMSALLDGRRWVRQNAALLLGRFGDRRAVPSLMMGLHDPDSGVRAAAVEALGTIGSPDAAMGLVGALGDGEEKVRMQAAGALGHIKDAKAVVPLIGLFTDPVRQVRDQAVRALADIGLDAAGPLIMSLQEDDPGIREYAAKALTFVAPPEAIEPLIDGLEDSEWAVRRYAAEALGKLVAKPALPFLLAAKDDPIDFVRERARQALDKIDPSGELRKTAKPMRRRIRERQESARPEGRPREPGMPGSGAMDVPEAYVAMGLGLDATRNQVRQAWKELMRTYHPDVVAHLTSSERAKAEEQAKRVNVAYDVLMRALPE
ncbi:MAG: HEAT repeat domain-containing protein [Candidatus Eisenbacteria bacterium]|nr:HEAT repeat domain-containing protein [Candidatus Eisenbacteria bacterium]